jgi:hypothetical protein
MGTPLGDPLFRVEERLSEYTRGLAADSPVSDLEWQALPWVPRITRSFTGLLLRREDVVRAIAACPPAAYYCLTNAGRLRERFLALAPALEPAILSDGETLVLYLSWAQQLRVTLPLPFSRYREALLRDPLHGILWALAVGDREFAADLLAWAGSHTHEYASAAWVVAVAEAMDPECFRPVLSLNPKYAIAAAATFGMRFALHDFQAPLGGRWLYHLLANNGCENPDAAEEALLASDPAWGLEWLIERDRLKDRRKNGLLIQGMKQWWEERHPFYESMLASLEKLRDQVVGTETGGAAEPPPAPKSAPAAEPFAGSGILLDPWTGKLRPGPAARRAIEADASRSKSPEYQACVIGGYGLSPQLFAPMLRAIEQADAHRGNFPEYLEALIGGLRPLAAQNPECAAWVTNLEKYRRGLEAGPDSPGYHESMASLIALLQVLSGCLDEDEYGRAPEADDGEDLAGDQDPVDAYHDAAEEENLEDAAGSGTA